MYIVRINVRDHALNLKRDKLLNGSVQAYCSVLIHEYFIKDVQLKGKTVIEGSYKRKKEKLNAILQILYSSQRPFYVEHSTVKQPSICYGVRVLFLNRNMYRSHLVH